MRMTWIPTLALVAGLLVMAPGVARAGDLTVRDVVELHRAGLGDDVLLALIEVDGGPFALDHPDLLYLKAEGLSDLVIAALVRTGRQRDAGGDPGTPPDASYEAAPGAMSGFVPVPGFAPHSYTHTAVVAVPIAVPVHVPRPRRHVRGDEHDVPPRPRADAIRHAPPGFHPGVLGPRTATAPEARPTAGTRDTSKGVARGAAPADAPTPGVARSRPRRDR